MNRQISCCSLTGGTGIIKSSTAACPMFRMELLALARDRPESSRNATTWPQQAEDLVQRVKASTERHEMNGNMVTTALELPGYRITRNHGVVRGLTVRSRSIVGNFFGGLQTLLGGNITI